jgi:hypothetical protein
MYATYNIPFNKTKLKSDTYNIITGLVAYHIVVP